MSEQSLYLNRELSWLSFNQRVLEEAEREDVPLCERLNFLSIYQSNLDEFFMVRVGALTDQMLLSKDLRDNKTGMTAREQLQAVLRRVRELDVRKTAVYTALLERLRGQGIRLVEFQRLDAGETAALERYFDREIAPFLSPMIVGKRQPFPFLRSGEIYAVVVIAGKNGKEKLGIIPCGAGVFPRLIPVPEEPGAYMLSEEVIIHFIPKVFGRYQVRAKSLIRVTRSADIDADALYDEDLDYREFMAEMIRQRKRLAPVRLELTCELGGGVEEALFRYVAVEPALVYYSGTPLDLSFLAQLRDGLRERPQLFYEKRSPQPSAQFRPGASILSQIRAGDKLLSYPFHAMKPFLDMLREAAYDRRVTSIKMTLYRVARQSKVVETLIEAAENGKEVLVLVELKARFDESNNIHWSRRLEEAGCQVIYGLDGYKVHSKLCLITRRAESGVEYYTQIGTGNYNETTARLYTDLSLMTADQAIGRDAAEVFQALALGELVEESRVLLVAPKCLQRQILEKIDGEIARGQAGQPAYIGLKLNALTDKAIIDRLIAASRAGVTVELVVRGICCLRPCAAAGTGRIRVVSVVGRFLEHSRIYFFGVGERQQVYLSSADLMTRNTLRRVEVAAPVYDPALRQRLTELFQTMLRDNRQARQLGEDGRYTRVRGGEEPLDSQEYLFQRAYQEAAENMGRAEKRAGLD